MAEPDKETAELTAIFRELARVLTLLREVTRIVESVARKLTELEKGQARDERT